MLDDNDIDTSPDLDDEDLDSDLAPETDDDSTGAPPEAAATETAATPAAATEQAKEGTQEAQEGTQRFVPLPEHIETRRRAQEAERQLNELRQEKAEREAREKAEREQATIERTFDHILDQEGPEAAAAYLQRENDRRLAAATREADERVSQAERSAEQREVVARMQVSAEYARKQPGSTFDADYERLCNEFGAEWTDAQAARAADPATWVQEFAAKKLAPTPERFQEAVAAEVKRQLADLKGKQQPAPTKASSSVAHVAASANDPPPKTDRDKTDAELEAEERAWEASH